MKLFDKAGKEVEFLYDANGNKVSFNENECECEDCDCDFDVPQNIRKILKISECEPQYYTSVDKKTGNKTVTCVLSSYIELRNSQMYRDKSEVFTSQIFRAGEYDLGSHIESKHTVTCLPGDTYSETYGKRLALNGARAKALKDAGKFAINVVENLYRALEDFSIECDRYYNAAKIQHELYHTIAAEGPSKKDFDEDAKNA